MTNPQAVLVAQAKLMTIFESQKEKGDYSAGDMFDYHPTKEELTFDEKTKKMLVYHFGDLIEPVSFKRKCYYTAILSGDHVFKVFKSLSQQGFSVKFKTGTYNAADGFWTGMVNSMMEPAKYYNKALTELMFTIAANSKGGVMVEEDAVESIADFSSKYAKTDATIVVRSGALAGGKIQDKARPQVPSGLQDLVMLSDAAVADTSGIDKSFLGSKEGLESGVMYKRRIRQIVSTMARYMDSVTLYQKLHARLLADYIRVYAENNDGSLFRITGEDGSDEFAMIAADKLAPEYDVTIQEASTTPEDKQETAETLTLIGDKYLQVGDSAAARAFHAEALRYLPLDGDVQSRLLQVLQPNQETVPAEVVQQLQAQIEQLTGQLSQLQAQNLQADTQKKLADAELAAAKIQTERANASSKLEEATAKGIENDLMLNANPANVSITI
jgi:hypothetical protein